MSAFFVGIDHINAMLSYIDGPSRLVPHPSGERRQPDRDTLTDMGVALIQENIASLRYRYPDDWQELVDVDPEAYRYEYNAALTISPNLAIQVLKMVNCYEYQSCEHPGWEDSWAHGFCHWLTGRAVNDLPGYDDAPGWEYRKPKDAPTVIRLSDLIAKR